MNFAMDGTTPLSKDELLYELLKKEFGYYKAIEEIALEENRKLHLPDGIAELKPLTKKKKILLSCINDIEKAMAPLKVYWQEKKDRDDKYTRLIRRQVEELNRLVNEILTLDQQSCKLMEIHMQQIKDQTKAMNK